MAYGKPITAQDTHEVFNQPPPLEDTNLFATDRALQDALRAAGGAGHVARLGALGARCGSAEAIGWGMEANRVLPVLDNFDRFGHRVDEVKFHPAYHDLMRLGLDSGFASIAWNGEAAGHVGHAAVLHLTSQVDNGTTCPMTMTYAAVPALACEPAVADEWIPRIRAGRYDPAFRPASEKAGVTIGMAMTEKQGGSDVRANTTRAVPTGEDGWYSLTGHKWFCSAPMCDAFLTLAYAEGGMTCFLVPRWLPDGERNAGFRVMRLKDKLGDKSNASSEIEYHGALARRVGPEGRGVATIIQMVQLTRLDCVMGSASQMRASQSPLNAIWEGSGNVIALDVLRALGREPDALVAVQAFLIAQRGKNQAYDRFLAGFDLTAVHEGTARLMVEHAALAAQAAVLLAWDNPNADAFCTLRLGERGMAYGAFDAVIDCRAIIERAMPQG